MTNMRYDCTLHSTGSINSSRHPLCLEIVFLVRFLQRLSRIASQSCQWENLGPQYSIWVRIFVCSSYSCPIKVYLTHSRFCWNLKYVTESSAHEDVHCSLLLMMILIDVDTSVDVHIGIAIRLGHFVVKNELKSKLSAVFENKTQ